METKLRSRVEVRLNQNEAKRLAELCTISGETASHILKNSLYEADCPSENLRRNQTEIVYKVLFKLSNGLSRIEKTKGVSTTSLRKEILDVCTILKS